MQTPITYILGKSYNQDIQIPYNDFTSTFVNYVPSPDSTLSSGQQGYFSADDWDNNGQPDYKSSGYIYSNNAWRRVPTYTNNWDDLDPVINQDGTATYLRFLPLHKQITLTEQELNRVKETLQLGLASGFREGLVKINQIPAEYQSNLQVDFEGYAYIGLATNRYPGAVTTVGTGTDVYTKSEVDKKFNAAGGFAVPVATDTQVGGILNNSTDLVIDSTGKVTINKAVVQELPEYGTVRFAPIDYTSDIDNPIIDEASHILNIDQTKTLVNHYIDKNKPVFNLPIASSTKLGGIKVDSVNTNLIIQSDGLLNVKQADKDTKGVVLVTDDIDNAVSTSLTVPTAYAVKKEFEQVAKQQTIATTSQLGSIIVGQGLQVDSSGKVSVQFNLASHTNNQPGIVYTTNVVQQNSQYVPTSQAVYKFVNDSIAKIDTSKDIQHASDINTGVVYVNPAINQDKTTVGSYTVPTVQKVQEMIQGQMTEKETVANKVTSQQWLIIGTNNIDYDSFLQSANHLGIGILKLLTGKTEENQPIIPSAAIIRLGCIVVFENNVNQDQIYTILQGMGLEMGPTLENCINNFILIPGAGVFGQYLSSVN